MRGNKLSGTRGMWLMAIAAVVLLAAVGTVVTAQSQNQQNQQWRTAEQNRQQAQGTEYQHAREMIGADVFDRNGARLGSFEDIVLDENHERVLYAVISEGAGMSQGGDRHAIPWSMVQFQPQNNRVILPVDKSSFDNRQGIGTDYPNPQLDQSAQRWTSVQQWEQIPASDDTRSRSRDADRDDDGNIFKRQQDRSNRDRQADRDMDGNTFKQQQGNRDRQTGQTTARAGDDREMRKVSDLLGMTVQFRDGGSSGDNFGYYEEDNGAWTNGRTRGSSSQPRGSVDDLLIHRDGAVDMALVEPNSDFMQIGTDEFIVVPWDRFDFQPQQGMAMVDLTSDEAHSLVIEERAVTRFNDPNYRNRFFADAGIDEPFSRRDTRSPAGTRSMANMPEMEQWSDFASQCLGRGLSRQNQVVEGRVLSVGTLRTSPDAEAPDGRAFTVETPNNRDMRIYLGPDALVPQDLNLERGAQVTVRGAECEIDNRDVMVASSIEFDGKSYTLTDQDGVPHWMPENQQQERMRQR